MSEFKTTIPLPLDELLKLLPSGSALHPRESIKLSTDKTGVEVTWYNENIKTNATRPVDYPLESLRGEADAPTEIIAESIKVQNPKVAPSPAGKVKQSK